MGKKSLKVDRDKFEGIVKTLVATKPVKREKVKVAKKKPEKLIPPDEDLTQRAEDAKRRGHEGLEEFRSAIEEIHRGRSRRS